MEREGRSRGRERKGIAKAEERERRQRSSERKSAERESGTFLLSAEATRHSPPDQQKVP